MKYFRILLSLIILVINLNNMVLCQNKAIYESIINKKFNYQLEFENISAGNAFISIGEDVSVENKTLRLKSKIKTNRFLDFFYKIRDEININMNFDDFSLIEVINKIREGKYKKHHHAIIDMESMEIITSQKRKPISKKIYSPLSIIFALRNEILNNNDIYNYQVYSAGKLKDINISVIGKENIRTPYGVYEAIILSPKSIDGKSAMKNKGDMKIWLTNDEKRLPLKIELKLKHGSILLLLDNIE
tara:strand:- start:44 stop:778 length:735 start_codon:yes stop_codon:yes gene_type:complete